MIKTISNAGIRTNTKTVVSQVIELGPGKVTADQGGIGFPQAGVAEYQESANGGAAPAYDFIPASHFLQWGIPQVDYRAVVI